MAIIRKSITGLKPGSDYLFALKPKNVEIAAADSEQETIRVSIPVFSGTPSIITGLQLASNFQTVIFKFDPINDADLSYFEYQLYDNEFGTGTPINPVTSTSNDPVVISGTNVANVFLVSVENSTDTQTAQYWGRVRAVNIAGNPSTEWSDLIASGELDLISDGFIGSLTAAKITSGTIGAHTIELAGATSIIQSSNYDPNIPIQNRQGWIIKGDGSAEFSSTSIRGTISAQSIYLNSNNRWGRNSANTADSNEFKVGTSSSYLFYDVANNKVTFTGELSAATGTFQGRLQAGDIYIPNATSPNFSVNSSGMLTATGVNISGTITATSGSFTGSITAISGSFSGTIIAGVNGTTQFGNNINGASNFSGFKIGNTGWENAWVQRNDGSVYFNAQSRNVAPDGTARGVSRLYIDDNNALISFNNGTFSVDYNGALYASNANISGTITASLGTIGGFTLSSTSIASSTITINSSTNRITIGVPGTNPCIRLDADEGIFIGHSTFSSAPFSVTMQGGLKASSGTIGGFTISSSSLTRTGTGTATRLQVGDECVLTGSSVSAGSISGAIFASTNSSTTSAAPIQQVNSGSELRRFTSREEYKYDIADLDDQDRNLIDKLRPRKFKWKWIENYEEPEDSKYLRSQDVTFGFIAEEMASIETEGRIGSFGIYEPYQDSFRPIFWRSYDLISLLVAEVQDLRKRISLLES